LQHSVFAATSGPKNKINVAFQAVVIDNVFDELRFINKVGTQIRPQLGEERRTHVQNTGAVIHGERKTERKTGEEMRREEGSERRV
jgi:hypothetical protein